VTVLDAPQAYARWAARYPPRAHNLLMEIEERAVSALLPDVSGCTALDLGCGSGRYARLLLERGAVRVVGVDRSPEMLNRACLVLGRLVRGDLRALPLRNACADVAVCALALGDFPELGLALAGFARVLRPGGVLVCSDLHPLGMAAGWTRSFETAAGETIAVRHYPHEVPDLVARLEAEKLEVEGICEPPIEVAHPCRGWPAVVAVKARKRAER